jgi:YVTN family beta-propeller protein
VPSDERSFERVDRITGALTPKSVVASGDGLVVAQNMVYTHTVSVFSSDGELLETIDDTVTPADYGYEKWDAPVHGGPVEAAFSPDRKWLWVSNYSMTGPGFGPEGSDQCTPGDGTDDSFLYRIDTQTLQIQDIALVGAVPKYVEVTPDGHYVLVTNWCTWDMSVVDTRADGGPREVARVPIGRYPRGIVVSPDSRTAYVAVMGKSHLAVVDLEAAVAGAGEDAITRTIPVGRAPRHINASPDGRTLYVTVDHVGTVAKVDAASGEVLGEVRTGQNPRSSALSPDGTALFVVNYSSDTVSRVRTSDMTVLETIDVDHHPIGITYDADADRVWVASYGGSLTVLADQAG